MNQPHVFHPFLIALFPVLFLFANNINELYYIAGRFLPRYLLFLLVVTTTIYFLLRLFFVSNKYKAGLIVTCFLFIFFSYGYIFDFLYNFFVDFYGKEFIRHRYLLICAVFVGVSSTVYFLKTKKNLFELTKFFNVTCGMLLFMPFFMIVTFFFQHKQSDKLISFFEIDPIHVSEKITSDEYPDIYYIILDGYANSSVLENFFGYDNKEFLDFLHTKNFFIADKSTSNYGYTYASLASSLNMSYLDEFAEYLGPESHDLNALSYVIENNQVQKILMNQGYSLVYFSSGYPMTNFNKHAEISFGEGLDRFSLLLLNNTMLRVFIDPTSRWRFGYSRDDEVRKRLFFTSDTLSLVPEMSKIQTPRFVVSHIVLPHEPYVFDQYGNSVKSKTTYEPDEMTMRYREQLIYLNTHVEKIVDSLLEKSEIPPIIIIQSDHGATPAEITGEKYYKFYNFTAIHIPDSIEHTFYGSVTPVNIFRIIFNDLFETQFPILKDRVFVPENLWYDFREVTDLVRSETAYNSLLNSEEERIDQ